MIRERELQERMRDLDVPNEAAAEERSWRVVRAAHASRRAAPRRPRLRLALAPAALALLALVLATSGTAIGDWISDLAHPGRDHAKPALSSLPDRGRLLVSSPRGPWVVRPDGSKRLLGDYHEAAWSPHGLFVVATQGRQLVATQPNGHVRWTLARPDPVEHPAWSPSGFRIAYLTGGALRVVAGDGTGDRLLAAAVAPATPAWRPGAQHVLAYSDRAGRIRAVATDTGQRIWTSRAGAIPHVLEWSADGRRVAVVASGSVRELDGHGRLIRTLRGPVYAVRFAPTGHRLALSRPTGLDDRSEVLLLATARRPRPPAPVFVGAGSLTDLAWSPNGRWLLIGWPDADQWLFIRPERPRKVIAVSNVAKQFSPGAPAGRGPFPRVDGWCCATRGAPG
ncbi:MAG: hypothetical protein QOI65_2316 [Thermoleophilaceae bacterium]|nr:hypothetical protein [Thermoleophilaceae bacterium]